MKISEIIKKIAKGEELNALEIAELERLDVDGLTQRAADAENKLKEAQEKLDAAEQEKLTEQEKLKKRAEKAEERLKAVENERDEAKRRHDALVRRNRINELAAKHKCEDPEFLDYLAGKREIDIDDDAKASEFIAALKKDNPKYFAADIKPGAGPADVPKAPEPSKSPEPGDRIGKIIEGLQAAPEVK